MFVQQSLRHYRFHSINLNGYNEFLQSSFSRLISNGTKIELVDVESAREWSMQNEEIARATMKVPPPPPILKNDDQVFDSNGTFIDYLVCRQWGFNANRLGKEEGYEDYKVQCALLSHALTFPLTLGNHVNEFQLRHPQVVNHNNAYVHDNERKKKHVVRLCCVGPRAEANLPLEMWREFLIFSNMKRSQESAPLNRSYNVNWIIDFIGPDVPKSMKSRFISLENCNTSNEKLHSKGMLFHNSLTMNYHRGFLHQYILENYQKLKKGDFNAEGKVSTTSDLLSYWDGFILFNPGIGHKNLTKSWLPTLKFILKTERKIVTTAHSELDSQRDLEVWKEVIDKDRKENHNGKKKIDALKYELNPFASRISYQDPFPPDDIMENGFHMVNPNHSILII